MKRLVKSESNFAVQTHNWKTAPMENSTAGSKDKNGYGFKGNKKSDTQDTCPHHLCLTKIIFFPS